MATHIGRLTSSHCFIVTKAIIVTSLRSARMMPRLMVTSSRKAVGAGAPAPCNNDGNNTASWLELLQVLEAWWRALLCPNPNRRPRLPVEW